MIDHALTAKRVVSTRELDARGLRNAFEADAAFVVVVVHGVHGARRARTVTRHSPKPHFFRFSRKLSLGILQFSIAINSYVQITIQYHFIILITFCTWWIGVKIANGNLRTILSDDTHVPLFTSHRRNSCFGH